jgi:hypothetical protein
MKSRIIDYELSVSEYGLRAFFPQNSWANMKVRHKLTDFYHRESDPDLLRF